MKTLRLAAAAAACLALGLVVAASKARAEDTPGGGPEHDPVVVAAIFDCFSTVYHDAAEAMRSSPPGAEMTKAEAARASEVCLMEQASKDPVLAQHLDAAVASAKPGDTFPPAPPPSEKKPEPAPVPSDPGATAPPPAAPPEHATPLGILRDSSRREPT